VNKIADRLSEELKTNFLVVELSVLHGLCDKGKELLKVEPAISYSSKNESGDESCSCFFQAAVLNSSLYDW